MILKAITITGCSLFGVIMIGFLNYYIIDPILIPDPCDYHGERTSRLFDLFYKMESGEGYHPFPTAFNFILTVSIGVVLDFQCINILEAY